MIEFYCENGQFHLLNSMDKDLGIMQKSMDKFKSDRKIFELSASTIIESEVENQSDKNDLLKLKSTQCDISSGYKADEKTPWPM